MIPAAAAAMFAPMAIGMAATQAKETVLLLD
jgi:hypothetical protein